LVRVFISGPIQGMEDKQEYRAVMRRILESKGLRGRRPLGEGEGNLQGH